MERVRLQGVGVHISTERISSMQNCARLLSMEKQLERAFLLSVNSPSVCVCDCSQSSETQSAE